LTPLGICLVLIEEFDEVLTLHPTYSILPLVRPTESNAEAVIQQTADGDELLSSVNNLVKNTLMRTADLAKAKQKEVLTRNHLTVDTVDDNGDKVLFRSGQPVSAGVIESSIDNGFKRKANESPEDADQRELKSMKLFQLAATCEEEKIVLDKNKRSKADFIHAVCLKRKSDSVIGASASNYVPTVNDDEVAPQASDERERAEKLVKIWCIHSPCSQYCASQQTVEIIL
jgi:hypothetical protein